MFVVPIHFNKEHRNMLTHAKKLMEYGSGAVAINPNHTKLITALWTALENGEGYLDKEAAFNFYPFVALVPYIFL